MPDQRRRELEAQLGELASQLLWPPTPDLAGSAVDRLSSQPARRPRRLPKMLLVAAVLVVVLSLGMAVSPGARGAVAERFGLRGVRISRGPLPSLPPSTGQIHLNLGQPVTLAEAARRVGFPVGVPNMAGFDHPDGVFVSTPPASGQVILAYRPRLDLPASAQTGVGLLLTEFKGAIEAGTFAKVAEPGTTIESVTVHDQPAYWIAGAPHALFYQGANGEFFPDTLRLATNTLVWQAGPVTLRVEGDVSKERALAIAGSLP